MLSQAAIIIGWMLNLTGSLWVGLILLDIILRWVKNSRQPSGIVGRFIHMAANGFVNLVRQTIPTVYRNIDFAPWFALLSIVLLKTFVFRALIYWGLLLRVSG